MKKIECVYSIARYVPDPIKNEPVNIGVVIQCKDRGYVNCRFIKNLHQKLSRAATSLDIKILQAYFDEFHENCKPFSLYPTTDHMFKDDVEVLRADYLDKLAGRGPGKIQFTVPQGTLTGNPEHELDYFFNTYIGKETESLEFQAKKSRLKTEIKREFNRLKILQRPAEKANKGFTVDAIVPGSRSKIEHVIDFTYENGKLYLVETVDMRSKDEDRWAYKTYEAAVKFDDLRHGEGSKKIEPYSIVATPDGDGQSSLIKLLESYSTVYRHNREEDRRAFYSNMSRLLEGNPLF